MKLLITYSNLRQCPRMQIKDGRPSIWPSLDEALLGDVQESVALLHAEHLINHGTSALCRYTSWKQNHFNFIASIIEMISLCYWGSIIWLNNEFTRHETIIRSMLGALEGYILWKTKNWRKPGLPRSSISRLKDGAQRNDWVRFFSKISSRLAITVVWLLNEGKMKINHHFRLLINKCNYTEKVDKKTKNILNGLI